LKIPNNVQVNIVPYYYNSLLPICWTAGTWGSDYGMYGKPWVSQSFGYEYTPFPPWNYHAAHDMVHEWFHALDDILIKLGFPEFPAGHDIHDCDIMGCESLLPKGVGASFDLPRREWVSQRKRKQER